MLPLFTDIRRGWKVGVSLMALLGLCAYFGWFASTVPVGWRTCLEEPAVCDGVQLAFPLHSVVHVEDGGRFLISKVVQGVPIVGDADVTEGMTISVVGRFRAEDQVVVMEQLEHHKYREMKSGIGVLATLLAVFAMPVFFVVRGRRVCERG